MRVAGSPHTTHDVAIVPLRSRLGLTRRSAEAGRAAPRVERARRRPTSAAESVVRHGVLDRLHQRGREQSVRCVEDVADEESVPDGEDRGSRGGGGEGGGPRRSARRRPRGSPLPRAPRARAAERRPRLGTRRGGLRRSSRSRSRSARGRRDAGTSRRRARARASPASGRARSRRRDRSRRRRARLRARRPARRPPASDPRRAPCTTRVTSRFEPAKRVPGEEERLHGSEENGAVVERRAPSRPSRRGGSPRAFSARTKRQTAGAWSRSSRHRSRSPRAAVALPPRRRIDPDLLELHCGRSPGRRLGLEQDRAVLHPEPRPSLLDLRPRAPAEALRVAPRGDRRRAPPRARRRRRERGARGRRASPAAGRVSPAGALCRRVDRLARAVLPRRGGDARAPRPRARRRPSPLRSACGAGARDVTREAAAAPAGGNRVRRPRGRGPRGRRPRRARRSGRARASPRPRGRRARRDPRRRTPRI